MDKNTNGKPLDKSKLIANIALIVLLCLFIAAAFVYEKTENEAVENASENSLVGVHIKGAVKNSGYYEVPMGTRVRELIDIAGGFEANAFWDGVNLAEYVKDGSEVFVPYKGTAERGALNLNAVTKDELCALVDGIGEERANKIIEYREKHNGFTSLLELDDILGKSAAKELYDNFYLD